VIAVRFLTSLALILTTTACANADERLCQTSLKLSLLNPETAEFFDFKAIDLPLFVQGIGAGAEAKLGRSLPNKTEADKTLTEKLKEAPEAKFYSVRVKADGAMGNKITKMQVCFTNEGECSCRDAS
jgi:hypothetical protein